MLSQSNPGIVQTFAGRQLTKRAAYFAFLVLVLASFAALSNVLAQGTTSGGFRGLVRDQATGNPIAGARVIFRHQLYGTTVAAITDQSGVYTKSSLPPGDYDIEVSANGFVSQKKVQTLYAMANYVVEPDPFFLTALAAATTNPTAAPTPTPTTSPSTATTQTGTADTTSTELNSRRVGIFDRRSILTLPLGGTTLTRTFDELAFLVPGVNPAPQAIGNSVGPGVGGGVGTSGQFSVNGLRSRANNFTVDGSDNNDEDIGVRRQGFFTLVPQPIESIQEFQIITLLAPAEFGRNLGAQVNALSQSGGNRFHGTIYGMLNSERLNARNFFDNAGGDTSTTLTASRFGTLNPVLVDGVAKTVTNDAGEKDKNLLLQGGFGIGGRIVSDKAFFFVSAEGQYLDGTRERNFAVPTVEQRGYLDTGALGLQQCQGTETNGICSQPYSPGYPTSVGGDLIFSLFPFANNPTGIYGRNTYTQALSTDARGGILSGRFDWNAFHINGNQQTFTARYNFTKDRRDLTDVGGALFSAIRPVVRTDNISTFLNGSITNSISNEFRFSWGRTNLRFDELPDTSGFLRPVASSRIANESERRFLLNAPVLLNVSLPDSCTTSGCVAPAQASYITSGETQNTRLGPIGQLNIAGFSPVGVDVFNFPQARTNDTYQFADTVRWQYRQNNFAFGTDIRRVYLDSDLPRNSRPLVTFFGGATDFRSNLSIVTPQSLAAAGAAGGFFQSIAASGRDATISLSYNQYDFFAQDEIRVSPRFGLNLGLRYEYNSTPKEADQKIESTFGQQFTGIGLQRLRGLADFIDGRTSIYDADRNNFAPRIGFAAAVTSNSTIRGGYGLYYDQIIGSVVSQSRNVFPTFTTANFGGGLLAENGEVFTLFNPVFAVFDPDQQIVCNSFDLDSPCGPSSFSLLQPGSLNTFNSSLTQAQINQVLESIWRNFPRLNGTTFGATLPARKLDTPHAHQYWIGFEHRFRFAGNESVFSAAYVGTSGRQLLRYTTPNLGNNLIILINGVNLNGTIPEINGSTVDPFSDANTLARPTPDIGPINQFETTGRSRYDSLQLGIRGRFSRVFQYQANYVYGKANDDVSDVFDLAGASALPQNSLTFAGEYGPANFDVRHRFTYDVIYDLPLLNGENSVVKTLFGSWTLAGTGKFYTGQPFTVNSVFDINQDGNLTDRLDNTSFLTVNDSRLSPLSLNCTSVNQCRTMFAPFGEDGSVARNSFRAGNVLDLDLSISKRFSIAEGQNVQFRMDVFNFINRANFGVPVRFLEAPGFGTANDTITPARRIQFVLKYNF
jgi:hypothetical protein